MRVLSIIDAAMILAQMLVLTFLFSFWLSALAPPSAATHIAADDRPRVIVSTDIGGTDPDDFQSMVHFLVYSDMFDVEGLISSPYGPGRKAHLLQVIDNYAVDYPNLKTHSARYPTPDDLRRVTKQGAIDSGAPAPGRASEGSEWIVRSARRQDPRPLWILVWGGIDDLAQALHDAPDIEPKLRVYFIGGPNKMWSADAYDDIELHHPRLWMIEANTTYRGWFTGGDQSAAWDNTRFVTEHVAGRGALGDFFATQLKGTLKMGDSPSVVYVLQDRRDDPSQSGWGGRFVPVWDQRKVVFDRHTTAADRVEAFGIVEFALPVPAGMARRQPPQMIVDGRVPVRGITDGGVMRFRFSPRDAKVWSYDLEGVAGQFTAVPPSLDQTRRVSSRHPNWWTDDPDPAAAEGIHPGAKNVSRWRHQFLQDFALRMRRCQLPVR